MPSNNADYLRQPAIRKLLNRFITKLDKTAADQRRQRVMETITSSRFPQLYDPQEMGADEILWHDILSLVGDNIISIERTKARLPVDALPWEYSRLVFNLDLESTVRQWLDRPIVSLYAKNWHEAVVRHKTKFANPQLLEKPLFADWNKSPEDIISRLVRIPAALTRKPMTAYQLSAQLFWGNSKLLKDKEQWLRDLFELSATQLPPRAIFIEITYPTQLPAGVLLIENQDTYLEAATAKWISSEKLILIYTQGFKGAAQRIRDPGITQFHINTVQLPQIHAIQQFEAGWYGRQEFPYPVYMVTDLDWSGMAIFRAAKDSLPELLPWQPGYRAMLKAHNLGNCHPAYSADKTKQQAIASSGSTWLDENVLPVLKSAHYVDQEVMGEYLE